MALSVPLAPLDFPGYVPDLEGNPLAFGWLTFYAAGTTTPLDTYADVNGDAANANPLQLDSSGLYVVFLQPTLYDIVVSAFDASTPLVPGAELYTREGIGNPGQIVFASLGTTQASGSKNVATGYQILSTDNLVTTPTGATAQTMQLPAASDRSSVNLGNGLPLIIMNFLSNTCTIQPDGADTINLNAAPLVLASGEAATLYSDGSSAWYALVATT